MGNYLKESSHGPLAVLFQNLLGRTADSGKSRYTSTSIADVKNQLRTEHLPNTNIRLASGQICAEKRYCLQLN